MVSWSEMPRFRVMCFMTDRGRLELPALLRSQDGRPRCRPGAISGCTWWATSRASTASAVWSGAARTRFRCGRSVRLGSRDRVPAIPGCHGAAPACPMKSTRRSSPTGFGADQGRASSMPRPWRPTGCLLARSGVETPTAEDLARLDRKRKRKGKKLSTPILPSCTRPDEGDTETTLSNLGEGRECALATIYRRWRPWRRIWRYRRPQSGQRRLNASPKKDKGLTGSLEGGQLSVRA